MLNQIRDVVVLNHRLDPVATELRIHVALATLTPTTQIKGRLMGPRCLYGATVEIAYPLNEIERDNHIVLRVIIPEPNWWDPQTPFLYEGPLELWQDGQFCERREIRQGIRSLQLTSHGLKLNGRAFVLRGKLVEPPFKDAQLRQWHDGGFNTLLTTVDKLRTEPDLWTLADRYGLFVIEHTNVPSHFLRWRNETNDHASVFGWVLHPALLEESAFQGNDHRPHKNNYFGVLSPSPSLPAHASFLLCSEQELSSQADVQVPKIVVAKHLPTPLPSHADILGWIESA